MEQKQDSAPASIGFHPFWLIGSLSEFYSQIGALWRGSGLSLRGKVQLLGGEKVSPPYGWQRFYEEAILETDRSRLPVLIRAAQAAIDARMRQLKSDHGASAEERQAITDALAGLRVLGRETSSN